MKNYIKLFKRINGPVKIFLLVFFPVLVFYFSVNAQERRLKYDVMRNGKIIGNIIFDEHIEDQRQSLSFHSDITTRFIFSFTDQTTETSTFENDTLVYAALVQKQTGAGNTDTKILVAGNYYRLIKGSTSKIMYGYPICYNTLLLYVKPPENIKEAYSQKYQKLLEVKKIASNKYSLKLPDGNYNYYSYKDGLCSRIDIDRSLFSVQFILKDQ